jgi:hypothetical protein
VTSAAIISKSEFARRRGVGHTAVANWIKRGKLSGGALTPDGMIDAEIADQQLGEAIDPVMAASARGRSDPVAARVLAVPTADMSNASRLLEARRISAEVKAELAYRELQAALGRYVLADAATAEFADLLSGLIQSIELSFPDMAVTVGLSREQFINFRKWWLDFRTNQAEVARARAAEAPEFEADPDRSR